MPSHELLNPEHSDCRDIDLTMSCTAKAWKEATERSRVDALEQAIQHAQELVFKLAHLKHRIVTLPLVNAHATMG